MRAIAPTALFSKMFFMAAEYSDILTSWEVSSMNDEKVVKAPKKPIRTMVLTSALRLMWYSDSAQIAPASMHPVEFTKSVPQGNRPSKNR